MRVGLVGCIVALWTLSGTAQACPAPSPALLVHGCRTPVAARLLLLPDEPAPAPGASPVWAVTGVYTGTEARAGGGRLPVGLFVHGGRVINPNLGRMDGILLVSPDGALSLHHSRRVRFDGQRFDLRQPDDRAAFARAAAAAGWSVAQSHLLIVDGNVDVRPRADAPRFTRRILFTGPEGIGLWQSPMPMTLYEASLALADAHAPRMALNLDMGSYNYCWRLLEGANRRCGLLGMADLARVSNLIVLQERPRR
ncbi:MAG: hypothetical protein ACFBRM_10040 [Pikeienuella sp.]